MYAGGGVSGIMMGTGGGTKGRETKFGLSHLVVYREVGSNGERS